MAEETQSKTNPSKLGSVNSSTILVIAIIVVIGGIIAIAVFFKNGFKSLFSKKDSDTLPKTDEVEKVEEKTQSVVEDLQTESSQDANSTDVEKSNEESITLPEDALKITRVENER